MYSYSLIDISSHFHSLLTSTCFSLPLELFNLLSKIGDDEGPSRFYEFVEEEDDQMPLVLTSATGRIINNSSKTVLHTHDQELRDQARCRANLANDFGDESQSF